MLHMAWSSQVQNGPFPGHSWSCQLSWWHFWENTFKKEKNKYLTGSETEKVHVWDAILQIPRSEKMEWEEVPQVLEQVCLLAVEWAMVEQVFPCSLFRSPHWSRWICPEGILVCREEPTLQKVYSEGLQHVEDSCCRREDAWGGREEGTVMGWLQPPFPIPLYCSECIKYKRAGWSSFGLCISPSCCNFSCQKINCPCIFKPRMITGKWSSLYLKIIIFIFIFTYSILFSPSSCRVWWVT